MWRAGVWNASRNFIRPIRVLPIIQSLQIKITQ